MECREEEFYFSGAVLIVFHGVQCLGSNGGWIHTILWIPGGQLL
jgi:hypothetical protein